MTSLAKNQLTNNYFLSYFSVYTCLVPRRLSCDGNLRTKDGGKGKAGFHLPMVPRASSPVTRVSRSPLFATKVRNEAPEE